MTTAEHALPLLRGNSARAYCAIHGIAYLPCEDFSLFYLISQIWGCDRSFTQADVQAVLLQRVKNNDSEGDGSAERSAQSELLLEWCHKLHSMLTALVNTGRLEHCAEQGSYRLRRS